MIQQDSSERKFFYLVARGSADERWAQNFIKGSPLLPYDLARGKLSYSAFNTESSLRNSNIGDLLTKSGVDSLLITHRGSRFIDDWGKRHGIDIVATPFAMQKKFENKIWFDGFLKKNNLPHPEGVVLDEKQKVTLKGKLVMQEASSFGSAGTYFLPSAAALPKLFEGGKLKKGGSYLLRKFITGRTYGVTVFVHPTLIALSALRLQCFLEQGEVTSRTFVGIQWIESKRFSGRQTDAIEETFVELGKLLYKDKFFGFAHFDFILDSRDRINIIECNPRLSSATPQIFRFRELISNLNIGDLFLDGFFEKKKFGPRFEIFGSPDSSFSGSLLDLTLRDRDVMKIRKVPENGLYTFKGGQTRFVGPDVRKFGEKAGDMIFYSEALAGDEIRRGDQLGSVISNFPLFSPDGRINTSGRALVRDFAF
jgi:hypothetical protein